MRSPFSPGIDLKFRWKFSRKIPSLKFLFLPQVHITQYADSVASHLAKILDSDKHSDVISSAKYVPRTPLKQQGWEWKIEAGGGQEGMRLE